MGLMKKILNSQNHHRCQDKNSCTPIFRTFGKSYYKKMLCPSTTGCNSLVSFAPCHKKIFPGVGAVSQRSYLSGYYDNFFAHRSNLLDNYCFQWRFMASSSNLSKSSAARLTGVVVKKRYTLPCG